MIDRSYRPQDSVKKVTGKAKFAGDYFLENILHLKILFSKRPHALIKSISTESAQAAPGVAAVYTYRDIPENLYGLVLPDQPVLCQDQIRFAGDQIAAVVAETPEQASYATSLIEVAFQDLPILSTVEEALKPSAPILHGDFPENIAHQIYLEKGDVSTALAQADLIYEDIYRTPMQEHAFLEPEAGLAYPDGKGGIVLRTAGQSVFDDQRQIAHALGLPLNSIRVIYGPIGGAFGGREDLSIQILLALAAWKLDRPVQAIWSREESISGHAKRHAMTIRHRWGATNAGKIIGAEVEIVADAGAYMYTSSSVLECLHSTCVGPYAIPNITLNGKSVFTNNIPGGAFRGYGTPQAAFAAELHLSRIGEKLGIDPVTIRLKNCLQDDSLLPTGNTLPGKSSLPDLIQICAEKSGCRLDSGKWELPVLPTESGILSGYGFALGFKATGYGYGFQEGSYAKIILHGDSKVEKAEVFTSASDVGQGADPVLSQIAARELQLPTRQIRVVFSDTGSSLDSGATAASRITYCVGNAIREACQKAMKDWQEMSRPAIGESFWRAPATTSPAPDTGACIDNISYSYAALAAWVEIDPDTGLLSVKKIYLAQDVGSKLNPQRIEGQIEGAIIQAIGWTLYEDFQVEDGMVQSDTFRTYLLPTASEIPQSFQISLLENPDPHGPYGARGVGEIPFVPLAPAVVAGVQDACGAWFNQLPIKPEDVLNYFGNRLSQSSEEK